MRFIRHNISALLLSILFSVIGITQARAMSGTDRIVSEHEVANGFYNRGVGGTNTDGTTYIIHTEPWPEGTDELANHPLRTDGYYPWFSECPNAADVYDIAIRYPRDVNHLLQKLAAIKGASRQLMLNPAKERPKGLDISRPGIGAEFTITSQVLYDFYLRRGADQTTTTKSVPSAILTLYTGHSAVDLTKLVIAPNIEIIADTRNADVADPEIATRVKGIEEFVFAHKAKQQQQ